MKNSVQSSMLWFPYDDVFTFEERWQDFYFYLDLGFINKWRIYELEIDHEARLLAYSPGKHPPKLI